MSAISVIGLQWGDEAKGKLVDRLTGRFDIVVRYQGGANAGHTVVHGQHTYKLHHIPSGILAPRVTNVVGPGVVLNPKKLLEEVDSLTSTGIEVGRNLMLSDRAHVVFPWHIAQDAMQEEETAAGEKIGTTQRGIGPCYQDKFGRKSAVRLGDMYRDDFRDRFNRVVEIKQRQLSCINGGYHLDSDAIYEEYCGYAERLKPHVADTTTYLLDAVEADKKILFEGAQGALLDIDHGTYPFVTSSNSSGGGVASGAGIPAGYITKVLGVIKAYTTRVGAGPFPTEQKNAVGEHIRDAGKEFGTTTGRERRCGWFDAVAGRYAARLSGVDSISVMKLDVLSGLPEVKICVAYWLHGEEIHYVPSHADDLQAVEPVYETLPGWSDDIRDARQMSDLPAAAVAYLNRISELVTRPIDVVSVGPDRDETIFVSPEFSEVAAAT